MRSTVVPGPSPFSLALRGVLGVILGTYMLAAPAIGILAFIFAYGIFSLIDGVIAAIGAFVGIRGKRVDWGLLLAGLLGIGIGLLFLLRPGVSVIATSILVAAWMVAMGVTAVISAVQLRKEISGEWLLGLLGVLTAAFGIYLLLRPILAVAVLPLMIGSFALFWGILLLLAAFRLWRRRDSAEPVPA